MAEEMAATRQSWKTYLLWCVNEHVSFRVPEIESILSLLKVPHVWIEKSFENPWMILSFPDENAVKAVMNRCTTARTACELWAHSKSLDQFHYQLQNLKKDLIEPLTSPKKSFKIEVETFNKTISLAEKVEKIESFSYLPLEGPVRLKDPDHTLYYYEFWGLDAGRVPNNPLAYFFGRWICESQRHFIYKYSLKKRHFIGNTSMDPQLAMIMANMGQVQQGHLVCDPFVGTGSLLIAAAHYGGYVFGTDIDYLILHGKSKPTRAKEQKRKPDEKIRSNLEHYNLINRFLDVFVCDASRPVWKPNCRFDAIITDPPYGIRESTEKIGSKKNTTVPEERLEDHYPSKMQYALGDIYRDLLNFAADKLIMNGKLVFWIPIIRYEYDPNRLPQHPCLRLVANSEQVLTTHTSRRLITMEKIMEPEDTVECNAAVIHELQNTFRTKFFQPLAENDRPEVQETTKSVMRRSKRGQGITEITD